MTTSDFDFICQVLAPGKKQRRFLEEIAGDPDIRDAVLDKRALHDAILEWNRNVLISCYLYFYVLVRNALLAKNIDDRNLSDYIAFMLAETLLRGPADVWSDKPQSEGTASPVIYFTDVLKKLNETGGTHQFYLQAHAADCALYLSGLYQPLIESRENRKGAPGLDYYESMGRHHFQKASTHDLAEKFELNSLYTSLSDEFTGIRDSLGQMAANRMFLHESSEWARVAKLLEDIESSED